MRADARVGGAILGNAAAGRLGRCKILVSVRHARVDDLGGLAVGHTPALLQLVQEGEVEGLQDGAHGRRDEEAEHDAQTWEVVGRVLGVENDGTDDVSSGGGSVVYSCKRVVSNRVQISSSWAK